jgi:hypothetical protein
MMRFFLIASFYRACAPGVVAGLALCATPAWAGPPYITDDPEPTDLHHWEIYNYALGTIENGATAAEAGIELNYGGAKDLQLATTIPFEIAPRADRGIGDVQLAVKYKFLHQDGPLPVDLAFYPRVFLPTARGSSGLPILLPLWAQHDWKGWSLFGGGGYTVNPGAGNRNYWQQGAVLTHDIRPGLNLGIEYFGQGPAQIGDRAIHGMNLGAQVHLKGPFTLVGTFGQGLNRKQTVFYSALKLDL